MFKIIAKSFCPKLDGFDFGRQEKKFRTIYIYIYIIHGEFKKWKKEQRRMEVQMLFNGLHLLRKGKIA